MVPQGDFTSFLINLNPSLKISSTEIRKYKTKYSDFWWQILDAFKIWKTFSFSYIRSWHPVLLSSFVLLNTFSSHVPNFLFDSCLSSLFPLLKHRHSLLHTSFSSLILLASVYELFFYCLSSSLLLFSCFISRSWFLLFFLSVLYMSSLVFSSFLLFWTSLNNCELASYIFLVSQPLSSLPSKCCLSLFYFWAGSIRLYRRGFNWANLLITLSGLMSLSFSIDMMARLLSQSWSMVLLNHVWRWRKALKERSQLQLLTGIVRATWKTASREGKISSLSISNKLAMSGIAFFSIVFLINSTRNSSGFNWILARLLRASSDRNVSVVGLQA